MESITSNAISIKKYYVTTFYKFVHLSELELIKKQIEDKADDLTVTGLTILGKEGINATVSATTEDSLKAFKQFILQLLGLKELMFKDSACDKPPFRRFKIKIREEIVTLKTPDLFPGEMTNHHLSPQEWNQVLKEEKDVLIIDTRNWYEYKIGTFKKAINPKIDVFTEFPKFIKEQNLKKEQKVLIFCTGGIRCEKGILELQEQGFENVYQLEGGILNYLEKFPNDQYEGECFVFDHRVALDQDLAPTKKYQLCPHCGQPAEVKIDCKRCDTESLICTDCSEKDWIKDTCSKNCAYQFERFPDRKGKHQDLTFEIERKKRRVLSEIVSER